MKGVPLRIEIGPKDIESGSCVFVRRDNGEKTSINLADVENGAMAMLEEIQAAMYDRAKLNMDSNTFEADSPEKVREIVQGNGGFVRTMWCGDGDCEVQMKELAGVSSRCIPLEQEKLGDSCVVCGKPSDKMIVWGVAY
jgi:prolyl-tRNA synthetase